MDRRLLAHLSLAPVALHLMLASAWVQKAIFSVCLFGRSLGPQLRSFELVLVQTCATTSNAIMLVLRRCSLLSLR